MDKGYIEKISVFIRAQGSKVCTAREYSVHCTLLVRTSKGLSSVQSKSNVQTGATAGHTPQLLRQSYTFKCQTIVISRILSLCQNSIVTLKGKHFFLARHRSLNIRCGIATCRNPALDKGSIWATLGDRQVDKDRRAGRWRARPAAAAVGV